MNWIKDVHEEILSLDVSRKSLNIFGISVGIVFFIIAFWMVQKDNYPLAIIILCIVGGLLIALGIAIPGALRGIYKIWMGVAFAIGWVVSRTILVILFFVIITPIGFLARLLGKEFMEIKFNRNIDTHWVRRDKDIKINYEKMY